MVRRRAGWSQGPPIKSWRDDPGALPDCTVTEPERRRRIAGRERCRRRAAANSIASGSPSNRRQIWATAAAFSAVRPKPGWTAAARSTKRATASDEPERREDGKTGRREERTPTRLP